MKISTKLKEYLRRLSVINEDMYMFPEFYKYKFNNEASKANFQYIVSDDGIENLYTLIEMYGTGISDTYESIFFDLLAKLEDQEINSINLSLVSYLELINDNLREDLRKSLILIKDQQLIEDRLNSLEEFNKSIIGKGIIISTFNDFEPIRKYVSNINKLYDTNELSSLDNINKINNDFVKLYLCIILELLDINTIDKDILAGAGLSNYIYSIDNIESLIDGLMSNHGLYNDLISNNIITVHDREVPNIFVYNNLPSSILSEVSTYNIIANWVNKYMCPAFINGVFDYTIFYKGLSKISVENTNPDLYELIYSYLTKSDRGSAYSKFYHHRKAIGKHPTPNRIEKEILLFTCSNKLFEDIDDYGMDEIYEMINDYGEWYKFVNRSKVYKFKPKEHEIKESVSYDYVIITTRIENMIKNRNINETIDDWYKRYGYPQSTKETDLEFISNNRDDEKLSELYTKWCEIDEQFFMRNYMETVVKYIPYVSFISNHKKCTLWMVLKEFGEFNLQDFDSVVRNSSMVSLPDRKKCRAFANKIAKYTESNKTNLKKQGYTFNGRKATGKDKTKAIDIMLNNKYPLFEPLYKDILREIVMSK